MREGDEDRAAILARRQRFIALALGGLATGCTPADTGSGNGSTTTTPSSSSSEATGDPPDTLTESGSEAETETETETETGSDPNTFVPPTPRPCLSQCDPFQQDCPQGEKCVPYPSSGFNWDATKCVPVLGEGAPGDACVLDGIVEATDNCDASSFCWNLMGEEAPFLGECKAFCLGTPDAPNCAEGTTCMITNEGSITLCLDACDPLLQDCDPSLQCIWFGGDFGCLTSNQDLPAGEPCNFLNDCEPGSLCAIAELSPMCGDDSCCVALCDTEQPDTCAAELECASLFSEGQAPMGKELLGLCVPPGACGDEGCAEQL